MEKMRASNPEMQPWIDQHHPHIWMRSKFSTLTKVDYVTNNLAESFNNWINKVKALNIVDLVDILRQMIMAKFDQIWTVAKGLSGVIMPHVMTDLNTKSFDLKYEIRRNGDDRAEVSGRHCTFTRELEHFTHIVDIHEKTCTCREWQLTGKPCLHDIAFITSLNEDIENYVDHFYSIEKFKATYVGRVPACVDRNQWPKSDHGFFLYSPLLRRVAGRPRTMRIKGSHEPKAGTKKKGTAHMCPICTGYGHHWSTCKEGNPEYKAALAVLATRMKAEKKRATKKAIAQALASVGTSSTADTMISTSKSICGSNEVAASGPLALVPVQDPSSSEPVQANETEKTKTSVKKISKKARSKGTVPTNKVVKKPNKGAATRKGRKRSAASTPSTPSKKAKKTLPAAATSSSPSTPSKRIPVAVPHDSPAMGTRAKRRARSLNDLLVD